MKSRRSTAVGAAGLVVDCVTASDAKVLLVKRRCSVCQIKTWPRRPSRAIRTGAEDGRILVWSERPVQPPAGYQSAGWYVDPFADDPPR